MTSHLGATAPTAGQFSDIPMRPGRRRMLALLIAAGKAGVSGEALCRGFYGDSVIPPSGWASARCQIQRLRSQLTPRHFRIVNIGRGSGAGGIFVLSSVEVAPVVRVPAAVVGTGRAAALGIVSVRRMARGHAVSLPRVTWIDGVAP